MAHQLLQGRQRHPGLYHIPPKRVSKPMGVGVTDLTPHSMMTEQRAEPGGSQGLPALAAFERDEQRRRVGQRPFQAQIVSEYLKDFRGQRHQALLVSFAMDAHLAFGELHIFQFQCQDLAGTQTIKEHQADQPEIAISTEALPELGDFFSREGHDDATILFETQALGDGTAGSAIAEQGAFGIAALEVHLGGGNLLPSVKAIAATQCAQAMIHGSWAGPGILLELMTNVVDERGLGDLCKRPMLRFEPAGEVEQVVGVDANRSWRELPEALSVEESIRPVEFLSLLVAYAIRGGAGRHGRLIDHGEVHVRPQPQRSSNCLTLSRSEVASRNAFLRAGRREEFERSVCSGSGGEESCPFG